MGWNYSRILTKRQAKKGNCFKNKNFDTVFLRQRNEFGSDGL